MSIFFRKKKSFAILVTISIVFGALFFVPEQVHAQLPGVPGVSRDDGVPVREGALRRKEVGQVAVFGVTLPFTSWDSILVLVVRTALEGLSDSVVNWINEGDDGGPLFVTDPRQFFLDIGDNVAGQYIAELGGDILCTPFRAEVQLSLNTIYNQSRPGARDTQCTLSAVVNNIDNFINGNFNEGGWAAFYELTQRNKNNPYGAVIDAQGELAVRIEGVEEIELLKLNWSDGFLSWSECVDPPGASREDCIQQGPTLTPGRVIERQLSETLSSEITQLELADEFDEIVGALVRRLGDTFMNRRGIITSSGNRPRIGSTGAGSTGPRVICSVNPQEIVLGEPVEWTATAIVGSTSTPIFSWTGSGGLSGSGSPIEFTYTTPGNQTAQVTVRYVDSSGAEQSITTACPDSVDVSRFGPIGGSCRPTDPATGQTMYSQAFRQDVRWEASIQGGSGVYERIIWDGTDPEVNCCGIPVTRTWQMWPQTVVRSGATTLATLTRIYDARGSKNASVRIIDSDNTVRPVTIQCSDPVEIF